MEDNLEIQMEDVVKLVMQFLNEQMLPKTVSALQDETNVALNSVTNVEVFVSDITNGHWDNVLKSLTDLKIPTTKMINLYEQIVFELLELREADTAKSVLRSTEPMQALKAEDPDRYMRLERMCANPHFQPQDAYGETSKEKRRANLASQFAAEVAVVPPSRLMVLLGQALKWQQHQGMLPPGHNFDLFRGKAPTAPAEEETYPSKEAKVVKFGKKTHPSAVAFSADGQYLVTGTNDGFIEVWDPDSGKYRKDLKYQMEDKLMMHNDGILCLAFSRDNELLATGCQGGKVKVWKVKTGQCLRRFDKAHGSGVTCLTFARDGTQILTGSSDHMLRIHGLKSGKSLKEFRGHTSFVNDCLYSHDGSRVISCSSDGTMKVWDAKSADCLYTYRPPSTVQGIEVTINKIHLFPKNNEQIILCNRSSQILVVTQAGQVVKTLSNTNERINFSTCTPSPRGDYLHCIGEDNRLYSFNMKTDTLSNSIATHERDIFSLSHHPHRNIIATVSDDGTMRLWRGEE